MSLIVDTDIVSYIFKKDTRSALYISHLIGVPKFISFMSLAELRLWESQSNWGAIKQEKFAELLSDFGAIHSDEELCESWSKIKLEAKQKGRPIETADAWVAATALKFDIPLVTHNRKHFENIKGLEIISER